jgi:tetratricopeptide (TPR) repeat protein
MAKSKNILQDAKKRKAEELLRAQRFPEARVAFEQLCQQNPRDYDLWLNLGAINGKLGVFDAAEEAFKKALALRNGDPQLLINLARLCDLQGRFDEEILHCQGYLRLKPNDAGAYAQMGRLLHQLGRLSEAEHALREALRCSPDNAAYLNNLGVILCDLDRDDDGLSCYRMALQLNPEMDDTYCNLGNLYQKRGEAALAESNYLAALKINPQNADVHKNLGVIFLMAGRNEEALSHYQMALHLNPVMEDAYYNLGELYKKQGDYEAAVKSYISALSINPLNARARVNLGCSYTELYRFDEAISCFDEVLRFEPANTGAHWNLACLLLLRGNFRDGWREYEWRFQFDEVKQPAIVDRRNSRPLWNGAPLSGKTLLVYVEQGFGDTMQFCRYLPLVQQRVERVIFECQPELMRLLSGCFNGIEFIARSADYALPEVEYDVQVPLLSLPHLFGTEIDTIPNGAPYIHADAQQAALWRNRLDASQFKVGLVWAGNPNHNRDYKRSISLDLFAPLSKIENVHFYTLQKGPAALQAAKPPAGMQLIDLSAELDDFATTAAVIANLDLVIAVDTSVVHLAGAMGKPVWTLVYSPPDWRWLLDREDSPWYPTLRLFRRELDDEWKDVIEKVALELERVVAGFMDGPRNS